MYTSNVGSLTSSASPLGSVRSPCTSKIDLFPSDLSLCSRFKHDENAFNCKDEIGDTSRNKGQWVRGIDDVKIEEVKIQPVSNILQVTEYWGPCAVFLLLKCIYCHW